MNAPMPMPDTLTMAHPPPAMPDEPVIPLTVEAYHALIKAGIFEDGESLELLEGFVVPKITKGPMHESARRKLRRAIEALVSGNYFVDEQGAITTSDSEPEPDVFVIRGSIDDFPERHAGPDEVALVAEIADSSLGRDRGKKQRIYARAKMPVYWVVNARDEIVELYTDPSGSVSRPRYRHVESYRSGDEIPVVIDGKEVGKIAVTVIFGKSHASGAD